MMNVQKQRSQYHHGNLRSILLKASRDLIESDSASKFSILKASQSVQVSNAAPYRHFKNKGELLAALVLEDLQSQKHEMEVAASGQTPGSLQRLQAVCFSCLDAAVCNPEIFKLRSDLQTLDAAKDFQDEIEDIFGLLVREVALASRHVDSPEDVLCQTGIIWSMLLGLATLLVDYKSSHMVMDLDPYAIICTNIEDTIEGVPQPVKCCA